jgi:uncharacterized membrane protein
MQTITKVYDTHSHAQRALAELERSGVPTSEISLVANKYVSEKYENVEEVSSTATGAGVGAAFGGGAGLLAGLGMMAIPGIGPVVAAGWLASTALGAAAGAATGGLIGALAGSGVPEADAHVYAESLRRGGTMLTVRTDDTRAEMVRSVLDRHSPIDPVIRGAEYREAGWTKFDPSQPPHRPSAEELDRIRRQ